MKNNSENRYIQIASQVKAKILSGEINQGQKLASIRNAAENNNVSNITALKAYALLVSEGLIYSLKGKGYFVNDKVDKLLSENYIEILKQNLTNAVRYAKLAGVEFKDVCNMIDMNWE